MTFDFDELMRIGAIVKRDGDAALTGEDRAVWEAWRAYCQSIRPTDEEIRIFEILERLPAHVTEPFREWTLEQTAALWPLLREDLASRGVDVEAAEMCDED